MAEILLRPRDHRPPELLGREGWTSDDDRPLPKNLSILRRNWLLIGACGAVAVAATAVANQRATPLYRAVVSIRIDKNPSNVAAPDVLGLSAANEISTEMEMLRSRALAEVVAESLALQIRVTKPIRVPRRDLLSAIAVARDARPAEYELRRRPDGSFAMLDRSTGARLGETAPGLPTELAGVRFELTPRAARQPSIEIDVQSFEDAVDDLQRGMKVSQLNREASIVLVRYHDSDRELVHEVPNALALQFIAGRQDSRQGESRRTVRFLRSQIAKLAAQLKGAEDTLRAFREAKHVVSLGDEAATEVRRIADVRAQRDAIDAERAALAALLSEVRGSAAARRPGDGGGSSAYRRLIAFPSLLRNQVAGSLLSSLAAAEERYAELLPRRSAQDPDLQLTASRIAALEEQLRSIVVTYLRGLTNQVRALDATLARSTAAVERIPAKEVQFARLQRNTKVLEEIFILLQSKLKEAEIAEAVADPSVRVVDAAARPRKPVRPKPKVTLPLSLVAGLALGIAAALLREYSDRSVHTRRDILAATGVPVLGLIPHVRRTAWWAARVNGPSTEPPLGLPNGQASSDRRLATPRGRSDGGYAGVLLVDAADRLTPAAEAFSRLETNLAFARGDAPPKTVLVTSPLPGEGKTTVAINLAVTLAERGQRVLLIDADLRCGALSRVFLASPEPGLSNVLLGDAPPESALRTVSVAGGAALRLLPAGALSPNPAQLLASARVGALLESLRATHDRIVVDSPPLNVVADAALLGARCDGTVIVARSGITTPEALAFAMEQLRNVHASVVGTVLNDIDLQRDDSYDRAYRYRGANGAYGRPANRASEAPHVHV